MLKKNKPLIISIVCVFVLLIGISAALISSGRINMGGVDNADTTEPIVTEAFRYKNTIPPDVVAVVYSSFDQAAVPAEEIEKISEKGFNTVIFDPAALNDENITVITDYFKAASDVGLYYGILADITLNSSKAEQLAVDNNMDFVIITGVDEVQTDYAERVTSACEKITMVDSAMRIGIEPKDCSKINESTKGLIGSQTVDFVYLCLTGRSDDEIAAFKSGCEAWNDEGSELWLYHDLSKLSDISGDSANDMIMLIGDSADMSLCTGISFGPWADIVSAKGTNAENVLTFIKKRETYWEDKEFTITNYSKNSIEVTESSINFRGSSSPKFELTCNGKAVERAETGDFSIDCKLSPGANTIKFVHKDKTYTYNVNYKIKLLKSVSPSSTLSVPGNMKVEVSAIALKGANVSASLNGVSYPMTQGGAPTADEEASPDSNSDFATYYTTIVMPKSSGSAQNLGKISVTAKYKSLSETLVGANVSVNAAVPTTAAPVTVRTTPAPTTKVTTTKPTTAATTESTVPLTDENGSTITQPTTKEERTRRTTTAKATTSEGSTEFKASKKYTPYNNNGCGNAYVCEIIDDYVEVYPGSASTTYSMPQLSPLLKGTFDYVTGEITLDGDKYYILSSGIKVPVSRDERLASGSQGTITHVKVTQNAYALPLNAIRVAGTTVSGGETVIKLDMNWKVVFNAELTGQTYSPIAVSGNIRNVGVSSLNCKALQFTFYNTQMAEGKFDLESSIFSSGSWSKGEGNTVILTLELRSAGNFYGYTYYYDSNENLVISAKHKPSSSLSGYTIMLDPGHGGLDSGAVCSVSATGYKLEKNINLSIAQKVKEMLEAEGAKVIMTRTGDSWVCYAERNALVRRYNPDMFISIHCDSSSDASPIGTSAYYYSAYSQPLAKAIHKKLVDAYKNEIYINESSTFRNGVDRGANFYAFRVTRVEQCPAILIEYGFVSNTKECATLQKADNRKILAQATIDGIKSYIASS